MTYWNTMQHKVSFFIKETLKVFDDFRNKRQVYEVIFFDM